MTNAYWNAVTPLQKKLPVCRMIDVGNFFDLSSLIWSYACPILSWLLYNISVKYLKGSRDDKSLRKVCNILAAFVVLAYSVYENYRKRKPSLFAAYNICGCGDQSIKEKYRLFIKSNHPDKSKMPAWNFGDIKASFEVLKDLEKCSIYDVFGFPSDDPTVVSRPIRELFEQFLIETGLFYGGCIVFFFIFSLYRFRSNELYEVLFAILFGVYCEMDAIAFYRSGLCGSVLKITRSIIGDLALFELRSFLRSSLVPILLFINNVINQFRTKRLSDTDKRERLRCIHKSLKNILKKSLE
mgnify:CR=1 FL=1